MSIAVGRGGQSNLKFHLSKTTVASLLLKKVLERNLGWHYFRGSTGEKSLFANLDSRNFLGAIFKFCIDNFKILL